MSKKQTAALEHIAREARSHAKFLEQFDCHCGEPEEGEEMEHWGDCPDDVIPFLIGLAETAEKALAESAGEVSG